VKNTVIVVAVAAHVVGGTACSSGQAAWKRKPGTLTPGTAQVTVGGRSVPVVGRVECPSAEENLSMIRTGDEATGAEVMVNNAGKLIVEYVRIRNLNSFTGNVNRGLEGDATVSLTGNTYNVSGGAFGYSPKSIAPITEPFTIKLAC
jgi:hypothetical protein